MASVNLGKVGLLLRGDWDSDTDYAALDVVSHEGYSYAARVANKNVEPSAETAAYWQPLAESTSVLATMLGYKNDAADSATAAAGSATAAASSAASATDALANEAADFSSSKAYAIGDYVIYNNGTHKYLYRFTSAHAAGAWIGTDAVQVTLADDVSDLKSALDGKTIDITSDFTFEDSAAISASNGAIKTGSSYSVMKATRSFVNIDGYEYLKIFVPQNLGGSFGLAFYSSANVSAFVSGIVSPSAGAGVYTPIEVMIPIPPTAKYVRTTYWVTSSITFSCKKIIVGANEEIASLQTTIANKVEKPSTSPNGADGQVLFSNGDGTTRWGNPVLPSDEVVKDAVEEWLTDHPEATTTVEDGSLTSAKFSEDLTLKAIKDYVTPEMYGAVGDGVEDDTEAVQEALSGGKYILLNQKYKITEPLTITNGTHIFGHGTIESYVAEYLFSGTIRFVCMSDISIVNKCTEVDSDGFKNGTVFYVIDECKIRNIFTSYFKTFAVGIQSCSVIDSCRFLYLNYRFVSVGMTDSVVTNCYINASKTALSRAILLYGTINNSVISNNFCDYWRICFRQINGSRVSSIIGNRFDNCKSVFQDVIQNLTIVGNVFSNVKYVAASWDVAPPSAEDQSGTWSIFLFDNESPVSEESEIMQLKEVVFTGNICRNCSYYIYVKTNVVPRLYGPCRFDDNDTFECSNGSFAGFMVTEAGMITTGRMEEMFLDFWDGKTYSELPPARLIGTTEANKVKSYHKMRCFVGGDEYININGTWHKYIYE